MRSVWQHHQHVNYCLYGSKRHMMMDIFNNAANPFYRFGQVLYLKKIAKVHWIPYIQDAFHKTGKHIDTVLAERICDTVECHPWYVQQLSFFVWSDTLTEATNEIFERQVQTLIDTNAPQFETDINSLAPSQVGMLIAIANSEEQLSAKLTVERYGLGGSQTIARNKKTLVEKDIVEYDAQRGISLLIRSFACGLNSSIYLEALAKNEKRISIRRWSDARAVDSRRARRDDADGH